jgi:16S rRNA (guanine(966)-N(2))-methyltransferase RsmD
MRIIAGQYRSRQIRALPGADTRPTSDRLRETLFDVLTAGRPEALSGSVWIDVFAGTGAVGLEALSRGAGTVYFIESSRRAAVLIRQNLRTLGITKGGEIIEREALPALRLLEAQTVVCDVCFLDPPYRMGEAYELTLDHLSQSPLLQVHSIVVAEHDKHFEPGEHFGGLVRYRNLRQGDAVLSFYRLTA